MSADAALDATSTKPAADVWGFLKQRPTTYRRPAGDTREDGGRFHLLAGLANTVDIWGDWRPKAPGEYRWRILICWCGHRRTRPQPLETPVAIVHHVNPGDAVSQHSRGWRGAAGSLKRSQPQTSETGS